MKFITRIILFLFLTFVLSSCLTTLYPIFFKEDVVFNPALLGDWQCQENIDNKNVRFMAFRKIPESKKKLLTGEVSEISDKGYFVSKMDSSGKLLSESFVFLAKLGDHFYLDNYPAELSSASLIDKNFKSTTILSHTSYRIDIADRNRFVLRRIDKGYLDKLIKSNKINIRHIIVDGNSLITADTKELRKFIIQHGKNLKAYATEENFERLNHF